MTERMTTKLVVLVDENDNERETMEKHAAHLNGGAVHRAFSVFVLDLDNRLMLQKRAKSKYHFGGLWTNTCCSHPRPGEKPADGALRRLREEMGLDIAVEFRSTFVYKALDPRWGLTEHELDYVFVGRTSKEPSPNPDEAEGWRWISLEDLAQELEDSPESFTPWFPLALKELDEFREVLSRRSRM